MNFHAKGHTDTGLPEWKSATLSDNASVGSAGHNCSYKVDGTGSDFTIKNRRSCLDKIEIDINSWTFTTVGIPILLGGFKDSGFRYRPAME